MEAAAVGSQNSAEKVFAYSDVGITKKKVVCQKHAKNTQTLTRPST